MRRRPDVGSTISRVSLRWHIPVSWADQHTSELTRAAYNAVHDQTDGTVFLSNRQVFGVCKATHLFKVSIRQDEYD